MSETTKSTGTTTDIKLVQKPVIEHRLKAIGESVTSRLEALNIDNLVATTDTVKSLKDLRVELNKEHRTFEDQRKFVKTAIAAPYQEFEEIYKTEISEKYTDAVEKLKDKISTVETTIKDEKLEKVSNYFDELRQAEGLDFLTWGKLGIDINLSTSVKKYKDQVNDFVGKVLDDLALIDTNEHKVEILTEYKQSLNVSEAIRGVQDRKKREAEEKERIRQRMVADRRKALENLGMTFDEMIRAYVYNDHIHVDLEGVEKADNTVFTKMYIELENEIKAAQQAETKPEQPAPSAPVAAPKQKVTTAPKPTTSEQPKAQPDSGADRIVTATFEAKGSYAALKALGQYMRDNGIEYKNI